MSGGGHSQSIGTLVIIDIILHVMGPLNDPKGGQECELPGL